MKSLNGYKLNEPKMFSDITCGVAVVINSETGIYYCLNEFGSSVFENLIDGVSGENILEALHTLSGAPDDIETRLRVFIKALTDSGLVSEGPGSSSKAKINEQAAQADKFVLEAKEYNDARAVLLTQEEV